MYLCKIYGPHRAQYLFFKIDSICRTWWPVVISCMWRNFILCSWKHSIVCISRIVSTMSAATYQGCSHHWASCAEWRCRNADVPVSLVLVLQSFSSPPRGGAAGSNGRCAWASWQSPQQGLRVPIHPHPCQHHFSRLLLNGRPSGRGGF